MIRVHWLACFALAVTTCMVVDARDANAQNDSVFTRTFLNNLGAQNSSTRFSSSFYQNRAINTAVPQFQFSTVNRGLLRPAGAMSGGSAASFGGSASRTPKPFSSVQQGGMTVSPYLQLSSPFSSSADTYYTQVRPQLDQQRANDQAMRQQLARQRELNSYAAKGPYDPQGSENMAPTGHVAVFMNLGGYYPQAAPQR